MSAPTTDRRMSDTEALMWSLEADPALRSAFISVTFLDRPPDFERLRQRVASAVEATPSLNHRVVPAALAAPRWEPDPGFDLDFHVRRLALPSPGTERQVLDLAALICQDPFDHAHPLWQFAVIEGVGDGAVLLAKMHHVLADGIGAVRMSASFLDLSPEGEPLRSAPPTAPAATAAAGDDADAADDPGAQGQGRLASMLGSVGGAAGSILTGNLDMARRAAGGVIDTVRQPQELPRQARQTVSLARSLARQLAVIQPARSPIWTGQQSQVHRFEVLAVDLGEVKAAAKRLGGTVNDVFVTAVVGAAGAYHRARGVDVDELRMSMPVSTRTDRNVGGNAWAPTRLLVPVGEVDPVARFTTIHERLDTSKHEPSLGLVEAFAGLARNLPPPLIVRLARQQTGTIDFTCSNVRGAPFDLWIGGAKVVATHPMGPTAGTAFNATVLSYQDRLHLGLNADVGSVDDTAELAGLIATGFDELFAAGR